MKTLLLKKEYILFFAFIAFFSIQAQSTSDGQEGDMQIMRIEFNHVDGPVAQRKLQLSFSEYTSDGYDSDYDTKNFQVLGDDLNLSLNGEPMLEQAYSPITEDKSVPLLFQASGSYTFTIKLTATENMDGQDLHLRDNLTDVYFNLKAGETYEFTSEAGNFPNRFELLFKTQSATLSQTNYELEGLDVYYALNRSKLVVLNSNNKKIKNIELYNIFGQSVYSNVSINEESYSEIQLGNLSVGTYIIKLVTAENGVLTKKILVK